MSKRRYYALAVLILLIASALRLWHLTTLPAGFSDLELSHINLVEDEIVRGNIRVFYERQFFADESVEVVGQEGLYHLVLSAASITFGMGAFSLRVLSVLFGMVTIAVMYTLGVRLAGHRVALITIGYYAVLMFPILLSRLVLVETVLPLLVASTLLALARAFPVYYRTRAESTNTVDYAMMGILIGLSFYTHEDSLFVGLMAMIFIIYIMLLQRQSTTRRLSYIGFGMLMLIIVAIPYMLSTWRLYDISANSRILGEYNSITLSIVDSLLGLMWQGDTNPLHNLPQRPMMDTISGILLIFGVIFSVQNWRNPRFGLILIGGIFLAPPVLLGDNSPNFLEMSVMLPIIVLLIGIGAGQIIDLLPKNARPVMIGLMLLLWVGNLGWTIDSLFNQWAKSEDVYQVYNGDIGDIALHFDHTADDIPIVICNPNWNIPRETSQRYSDIDLVKLHMNHDSALLREVDCRNGFVFANAGRYQQVLILEPMLSEELFPSVVDWLSFGTPVEGLPDGTVIELEIQETLEDALGVFITTSPASYANEADLSELEPISPPIRFGGNVTWLGYENDPFPEYTPGAVVPVATYWRIEGLVPSDLTMFTHILSDPTFPVAQIDTIYIDPRQLRERDIYLHNANIQLQPTIEPDKNYTISVGVYQQSSADRLPVFVNETATQGNRIFLYPIAIESLDN